MSTDLTLEFLEGGAAANADQPSSACPYLATSNAAEAWLAGHAWHVAGFSCNAIATATNGRGSKINLRTLNGRTVVAVVYWLCGRGEVQFPAIATDPSLAELRRHKIELAAAAPLRSKGKPVHDAGELPLFIAGNEPELF